MSPNTTTWTPHVYEYFMSSNFFFFLFFLNDTKASMVETQWHTYSFDGTQLQRTTVQRGGNPQLVPHKQSRPLLFTKNRQFEPKNIKEAPCNQWTQSLCIQKHIVLLAARQSGLCCYEWQPRKPFTPCQLINTHTHRIMKWVRRNSMSKHMD